MLSVDFSAFVVCSARLVARCLPKGPLQCILLLSSDFRRTSSRGVDRGVVRPSARRRHSVGTTSASPRRRVSRWDCIKAGNRSRFRLAIAISESAARATWRFGRLFAKTFGFNL